MKEKGKIILCSGEGCPLKDACAFYCPTMDKRKTLHWGKIPYKHEKNKCSEYEPKEPDIFNDQTTIQ